MSTKQHRECWLQISAGKGPAECAWAVLKVIGVITREAEAQGLTVRTLEVVSGPTPGTAQSALLSITGETVDGFVDGWRGTIQWTAQSPFRPRHKRKNWFVGIEVLEPIDETQFDTTDAKNAVKWETMRASGPGGQHVNRTESAVRVTHLPTGIQATATEERSQHRNRKLALARLADKLKDRVVQKQSAVRTERWQAHQDLERGNPVRTFRE